MLEDEELREKQGREMEILKLATTKAQDNLKALHTYADQSVDQPFLIPE